MTKTLIKWTSHIHRKNIWLKHYPQWSRLVPVVNEIRHRQSN